MPDPVRVTRDQRQRRLARPMCRSTSAALAAAGERLLMDADLGLATSMCFRIVPEFDLQHGLARALDEVVIQAQPAFG